MKRKVIIIAISLLFFSQWCSVVGWLATRFGPWVCLESNGLLDALFLLLFIITFCRMADLVSRKRYVVSGEHQLLFAVLVVIYVVGEYIDPRYAFAKFSPGPIDESTGEGTVAPWFWLYKHHKTWVDFPMYTILLFYLIGLSTFFRPKFYRLRRWAIKSNENFVTHLDGMEDKPAEKLTWAGKIGTKIRRWLRYNPKHRRTLLDDEPMVDIRQQDSLNFHPLLESVINTMNRPELCERSAYSIGVVGDWGSGKSTFMYNMKLMLEDGQHGDWITVDFNPRASESVDAIQHDFLCAFKEKLSYYHSGLSSTISRYIQALGVDSRTSWIASLWHILFQGSSQHLRDSISKAIESIDCQVAVFIDDLDRLEKDEVIQVFKLISKNASFAHVVFISGYSRNYLYEMFGEQEKTSELLDHLHLSGTVSDSSKHAIKMETKVNLPPSTLSPIYVEKYFKKEIRLLVSKEGLFDLFKKLLKRDMFFDEMFSEQSFQFLAPYVKKSIDNPRALKKYVNMLFEVDQSTWQNVEPEEYALVLLLKLVCYESYQYLMSGNYLAKEMGEYSRVMKVSVASYNQFGDVAYNLVFALLNKTEKPVVPASERTLKDESLPYKSIKHAVSFANYFMESDKAKRVVWSDFESLFESTPTKAASADDIHKNDEAQVKRLLEIHDGEALTLIVHYKLFKAIHLDQVFDASGRRAVELACMAAALMDQTGSKPEKNHFRTFLQDSSLKARLRSSGDKTLLDLINSIPLH